MHPYALGLNRSLGMVKLDAQVDSGLHKKRGGDLTWCSKQEGY